MRQPIFWRGVTTANDRAKHYVSVIDSNVVCYRVVVLTKGHHYGKEFSVARKYKNSFLLERVIYFKLDSFLKLVEIAKNFQ